MSVQYFFKNNSNLSLWFFQSDAGWEEYYDYIFPEDAANQPNRKLLAMVKLWKKQQIEEDAPERSPEEEETSTAAGNQAASPETDTNAAKEQKPEITYDDRDDEGSSSESDSHGEDGGEKESKQSEDAEKD